MKHIELFSGIGGFRKAMDLISKDLSFPIETVAYSEIDKNAIKTYCSNFNTKDELYMGDIVDFVKSEEKMHSLPTTDIITGGFPCQTFSMMGGQKGFNEYRGQMFFRIMDVINEVHPPYILLENVKNIINHDKGNTIRTIKEELEGAGYYVKIDIFNSNNFGLPQKRNRVVIFGRKKEFGPFEMSNELVQKAFTEINSKKASISLYNSTIDILDKDVESKYYLSEKIKPTILSDGSANFRSNSDIDLFVARPLTATMHKMHRACQDNYFSKIFIESNGTERPSEKLSKGELAKLDIRKITPKEAFLLQGFPNDFATKAQIDGVSNGALYKQAGNAVSVNTVYAILYYLITRKIIIQHGENN